MVVESLIFKYFKEKRKIGYVATSFFYTSLAIILAMLVFHEQSTMFFVFLTVLACVPFIYKTIMTEEILDTHYVQEKFLIKSHAKLLSVYLLIFLGIVLAVTFFSTILPSNEVKTVFSAQLDSIGDVRSNVADGNVASFSSFTIILKNNFLVLLLCLLFSLIYGLGAIFILTWNASVVGVAIGEIIRTGIGKIGSVLGFTSIAMHFNTISYGLLRYSIHGFLEILGYFTVGLAGGIISFAIIKHDFRSRKFLTIIRDTGDLILISIVLIFFGALAETYLTPLLF